jgi:integrase
MSTLKYGEGSLVPIKNSPGYYHYSAPLGKGLRSKRFRCKSLLEGRRLFEVWNEKRLADLARGDRELRTVGRYLETHWAAVSQGLARTTRALHQSTLDVHIIPDAVFCGLDIHDIEPSDIQAFLLRVGAKGASENTKARVYKLLRSFFQAAVEERILSVNPIQIARGKKPKLNTSQVISMTPEHEAKLLRYVEKDEKWRPIVFFALDSGVRMAELLGLKWDKVDLKRGEVHIHRTLDTLPGGLTILKEATKTDSSRRTIPLSECTLGALKGLYEAAKGQKGYVFGDGAEGAAISRHAFTKRWLKLLSNAGLPQYGFHSCRHTCATRLLRGGCYLTAVAARLGHARPSQLLDLYSDSIPSDQGPLAKSFLARVSQVAEANLS